MLKSPVILEAAEVVEEETETAVAVEEAETETVAAAEATSKKEETGLHQEKVIVMVLQKVDLKEDLALVVQVQNLVLDQDQELEIEKVAVAKENAEVVSFKLPNS